MVTLGNRNTCVPSVVHIAGDGRVLVGEAARRRAAGDPGGVAREFKRRVGDPTPILLGDGGHTAHELTARLARWVVDLVAEREGGAPEQVAVTHPAGWGRHKTSLLGKALAGFGLGDALLLSEPVAAALAYAATERIAPGTTIGVYDLGGGTLDTAVLRRDRLGSFELLGEPAGDDCLGGVDFDELLFERIRGQFPELLAELDNDDPMAVSAVALLRRECTEAKEALSADTEATIPVLLPSGQRQARIVRAEFEDLIRPAVEETVELLRRTIHSAGLVESDLTSVLLVGGSSRIPLVTELLSAGIGRPVAVDADPKAAVATGAVLSASLDTVAEPAPAIVAIAAPPRPLADVTPLHLSGPVPRHPGLLRPRVLAGAAGLALLTMAAGAIAQVGQTTDIGAPAQAATPNAMAPALAVPPDAPTTTAHSARRVTKAKSTSVTKTTTSSPTTTTSAPNPTSDAPAPAPSPPPQPPERPLQMPPPDTQKSAPTSTSSSPPSTVPTTTPPAAGTRGAGTTTTTAPTTTTVKPT